MNRRDFVKRSAILAAPLFVPASVLGRAGRPGANGKISLGFIGMGVMNLYHLDSFLGKDSVRVVAVCDVDTTRREHAKARVDAKYSSDAAAGCAAYNDHRELMARDDVDAVVIATPDHWHAIQVIDACLAGKDIYCEKPLSLTIHEAKSMLEAVRKYKRVLQTGSQQRSEFGRHFVRAVEYVRSGRIGQVLAVHVGVGPSSVLCDLPEEPVEPGLDWDRWLGPAPMRPYNSILSPRGVHQHFPAWRRYREYSGGTLTDMGAHHFDIAQWGLDADQSGPIRVLPPKEDSAPYGARIVYESGVQVTHGGPSGCTFLGTDGMIQVDRDRLTSVPESILKEPLKDSDLHIATSASHHDNWLESIASREKPICDVEVGARSVTVCHLVNLAYWYRRPLKWDPDTWEFPGDREANGWMDYRRRDAYQLTMF